MQTQSQSYQWLVDVLMDICSWISGHHHDSSGVLCYLCKTLGRAYTPGPILVIAYGTNTMDAAQLARLHDEFRHIHTNHINVDEALKSITLEDYDNMYTYTYQLEDYALEILMHLKKTYGFINPTHIAENYNKITAPINFQDPLETLLTNIEDGVWYANTGMQPHTDAHYVNIAFLLIPNTGAVPEACRDWQHRTPVNKFWGDFRRKFTRAQRKQHIIASPDISAGYHTANVAEHYVHDQLPADVGFVTAMANLPPPHLYRLRNCLHSDQGK
jgi:hypothetical protein